MKVGLVCPYAFSVPGGVQRHVQDLARHLHREGHEVEVLAPEPTDHSGTAVTSAGRSVSVPYNGSVARIALGPGARNRTRAWLVQGRFDVVHVHEPLVPTVSAAAVLHSRAPVVATFHSCARAPLLVGAAGSVLRPALSRVAARVAVSEHAAATVARLPGARPVVIANGVDTSALASAPSARAGTTVTFLGRVLEPRKGLAVLARALPTLLERHPHLEAVVAGPGDPRAARRLLPDDPRVRVLGEVSEPEKARLLGRTDVYVAPNTGGESFGITLVEAMAAGAPVVATDLPAFRSVLRDGRCGRLVPVDDPRALADAVSELLGSRAARDALAHAGRARAEDFDWSVIGARILGVYEQAVRVRA